MRKIFDKFVWFYLKYFTKLRDKLINGEILSHLVNDFYKMNKIFLLI